MKISHPDNYKLYLPPDSSSDQSRFDSPTGIRTIHSVGGIAERLGGPSRTVTSLCSSIARLGLTVDLVAGADRSPSEPLIRPEEKCVNLRLVEAYALGRLKLYPGFTRTLMEVLRDSNQPTLIHDHGIWGQTNLSTWRAAHKNSTPYVLSPRGMLEPWALEFKARKKKIAWSLYQHRIIDSAAVVVATSAQEGENIKKLFPKKPVAIIPNGVDIPTWPDEHAEHAINRDQGTVLFMSRIHPKKNLIGLLQAWKNLNPNLSAYWRLKIAGPDENDHTNQIAALIKELGLQASVEMVGPVGESDKAVVYRASDIFVLPSFSENFGVVVAEALAFGLPVIATTGTPWSDLPRRRCGWWVKPDPLSLSDALTKAMSCSAEERRSMGNLGRAYAQEAFSWDRIAQQTIDVYRWVLGQGTKPDCMKTD